MLSYKFPQFDIRTLNHSFTPEAYNQKMRLKILSVVLLSFCAFVGIAQDDSTEVVTPKERKAKHYLNGSFAYIGTNYRFDQTVEENTYENDLPISRGFGLEYSSKFKIKELGPNTLSLRVVWVGAFGVLCEERLEYEDHNWLGILQSNVYVLNALSPGIDLTHPLSKKSSVSLYFNMLPNYSRRTFLVSDAILSQDSDFPYAIRPDKYKYGPIHVWSDSRGINWTLGFTLNISKLICGVEYRFGNVRTKTLGSYDGFEPPYNYIRVPIDQIGKSGTGHLRVLFGLKL